MQAWTHSRLWGYRLNRKQQPPANTSHASKRATTRTAVGAAGSLLFSLLWPFKKKIGVPFRNAIIFTHPLKTRATTSLSPSPDLQVHKHQSELSRSLLQRDNETNVFFLACFREKKKSSRHKRRAWEGATFNCNVQWFPLTAGSLGAAHPRSAAVYVEPFSELHGFCEHHTKCALSQIPKVLATTTKICNDDGSTDTHVHSFNATVTPPYSSRRQGTHPSRASARKRRSKPMLP